MSFKANSRTGRIPELNEDIDLEDLLQLGEDIFQVSLIPFKILLYSPSRTAVINIYDNANKVFNLGRGLPVGSITWGSGSIGQASIATLAKDFMKLMNSGDPEWQVRQDSYTIEDIALKYKKFRFDDNYIEEFKDWERKPRLGFMVVRYSSGQPLAEEWKIDIIDGQCKSPFLVRQQYQSGITCDGEPEAITRLYLGFGTGLSRVLQRESYGSNGDAGDAYTGCHQLGGVSC